jgi:hypothetical protein
MSKKYIGQVNSKNFVYPNNTIQEYDREIIHNINNNSIVGSISGFTIISATTDNVQISFNYDWNNTNGADVFVNEAGVVNMFSVHMMTPNVKYTKPFVQVYSLTGSTSIIGTNVTGTTNINISSTSALGSTSGFTNGVYSFEVRFIGLKSITPVCASGTISSIVPLTPTPTPTSTTTPTPTPTIPSGTATPTPTPTSSSGGGGSYYYYIMDVFGCFPCSDLGTQVIGRKTTEAVNNVYYNVGDGNVYKRAGLTSGPSYDIDLDFVPGSLNCNSACSF